MFSKVLHKSKDILYNIGNVVDKRALKNKKPVLFVQKNIARLLTIIGIIEKLLNKDWKHAYIISSDCWIEQPYYLPLICGGPWLFWGQYWGEEYSPQMVIYGLIKGWGVLPTSYNPDEEE